MMHLRNLLEFAAMRALAPIVLVCLLIPVSVLAWGEKGHVIINQAAIDAAASRLPEFMNSARDQIIFNAWAKGGTTSVPEADYRNASLMTSLVLYLFDDDAVVEPWPRLDRFVSVFAPTVYCASICAVPWKLCPCPG